LCIERSHMSFYSEYSGRCHRAAKPVIVPEIYQGSEGWDDWIAKFENLANVNGWEAANEFNWIEICLTGKGAKKCKVCRRKHKPIMQESKQH